MPKKTKRQKIAAQMHKHRIIEKTVEVKESITSQQSVAQPIRIVKKPLFTSESTYFFRRDLMKSLIVSGLLLAVEIGIYIAHQNGLSFTINLPF